MRRIREMKKAEGEGKQGRRKRKGREEGMGRRDWKMVGTERKGRKEEKQGRREGQVKGEGKK